MLFFFFWIKNKSKILLILTFLNTPPYLIMHSRARLFYSFFRYILSAQRASQWPWIYMINNFNSTFALIFVKAIFFYQWVKEWFKKKSSLVKWNGNTYYCDSPSLSNFQIYIYMIECNLRNAKYSTHWSFFNVR